MKSHLLMHIVDINPLSSSSSIGIAYSGKCRGVKIYVKVYCCCLLCMHRSKYVLNGKLGINTGRLLA